MLKTKFNDGIFKNVIALIITRSKQNNEACQTRAKLFDFFNA